MAPGTPAGPDTSAATGRLAFRPLPGGGPIPTTITSTIDLTALQQRLLAEHTQVIDRIDAPARPSRRRREEAADPESTQVVPRGLIPGRARRSVRPAGATRRGSAEVGAVRDLDSDLGTDLAAGAAGADDAVGESGGPGAAEAGSTRSKALWTLADQAVSSATNAAISFLIAHQVSSVEYGAFGVAYTLFALVIGLSRGATCMPLSMFYSGSSPSSFRAAASATTGSSLVFGIAIGLVFAGVGAVIGGPVGSALLAMGLVLPGLLLQDAWRYVFFAMGRPFGAFLNDVAWAVVQVFGIWLLIHRGVSESSPLLLAWGASALVAALLGIAQAGFYPSPGATRRWLEENRTDATYLAAEFLTVQGSLQASILAIGAVGSLSTIGALQGARTLLGPTTVVGVGVVSFALPEFSKRTSMTSRERERAAIALSGLVIGIGAAWSAIFYFLPEQYGRALLGDSWDGVKQILGLSILHYIAAAVPVGPACMIYALGKTKITFRVNIAFAPFLLGLPVLGAVVGEARGAVIGFNIAFWIFAPVWFVLLRRVCREHDREQAALRAAADADGAPPSRRDRSSGDAHGDRPEIGRRGGRPGTPDRRSRASASTRTGWNEPSDVETTGSWGIMPEGAARRDRSIARRRDGNGLTKVRKADVPEELRREVPRSRQPRPERDRSTSRAKPADSTRRIGRVDDVDRSGRTRSDRPDGGAGEGRGSGPPRGRRGS